MSPETIVDLLASRLNPTAPPSIVSAYLFGSFSEGRSHRESDVDLGVLLDRNTLPTARDRFERGLQLSARLGEGLSGRQLDLVILNDVPPTFARRVVTTGRRLACADPEVDRAFVRDVQLRAADLEPFLRRMRQIKFDALSGS